MPSPSPRARSVCVLTVLTLAACGTTPIVLPGAPASPGTSSSTSSGSSSSVSSGSSTPSGGSGAINFGPCQGSNAPPTAVCGTLTVPLDYTDAAKGTIKIPIIKVPATNPSQRIGSLLTNPGGPGGSGVQFVSDEFAPSLSGNPPMFQSLNQRFDIIGFDPRGIGEPDAVACLTTAQLDALVGADPILDDASEKQAFIDVNKQAGTVCQQKVGRLLPYVGTENVARDMDLIRAALGDDKLSYLGFSYGTKIGNVYASMFPTHIRALVLDGDVDSSLSLLTQVEQQSDWLAKGYQEFLRRCTAQGACPLGSNPGDAINKLFTRLDAKPVVSTSGRSVGRGEALTALLASMYDTRIWSEVAVIFAQAINANDVNGLLLLVDSYTGRSGGTYDHQIEGNIAVNCVDDAVPLDQATYDSEAAKTEARDPLFGDAGVYGVLTCATWPVHGAPAKPITVTGAPPILLVGATNDPATPYSWSQGLQKQIQGSVLLTRDGYGHTSYGMSTCINGHVEAYLNNLTMPAAGITCPTGS